MKKVTKLSAAKQYYTQDEFRQICHIAKRRAKHFIDEGVIPAIDTHRKLNRYLIAKQDIEHFLLDSKQEPQKYGKEYGLYGGLRRYSKTYSGRLRRIAKAEWADVPDLLTAAEVGNLLGYRQETIYKWRIKFNISSIYVYGKLFIPKKALLDFMASPEFHGVAHKSAIHFDLIWRAYHA